MDAVIVLGNTFRTQRSIESMRLRTRKAVELWRAGMCKRFIFSGGFKTRTDMSEAEYMANIAMQSGVPSALITREEKSTTTIGNAVWTKKIMDELELSSAIVVTSPHHVMRTKYIFARLMPDKRLTFVGSENNLSFTNFIGVYCHEFSHMWEMMFRGINLNNT